MTQHGVTESTFEDVFKDTGPLSQILSGYERRDDQQEMADEIWKAFEEKSSAFFEAGTGIGKSLAYLVPALLWSYKTGEKVVISTYTIALQEQLVKKDLPMLLSALGIDLKVVLAKGMGNYVCLRKLDEACKEASDEDPTVLLGWSQSTKDGSRSSVPVGTSNALFSKVAAEGDNCSYVKCPHYRQCFFFKARNEVQEADIIIVNHHLLMAHLLSDEKQAILPNFYRLVVDEAHHFPSVARSSLARVLDRVQIFKVMGRIHSDNSPETSRFFFLRDALDKRISSSLSNRLGLDLPGEKRVLITKVTSCFDLLEELFLRSSRDPKWRLTPSILEGKMWQEELTPKFDDLAMELKRYASSLDALEEELKSFREENIAGFDAALMDIGSAAVRIKETAGLIEEFFHAEGEGFVRWAERTHTGVMLTLARLEVDAFLKERLFEQIYSGILCSATMTVEGDFCHIAKDLGLEESSCTKKVYPSPFDYQNRVKLLGCSDLPLPSGYGFVEGATEVMKEAIRVARGGVFILFTSYDMLRKCGDEIDVFCDDLGLPYFQQGEMPRTLMLEEFKREKNGVLLGADSFWEGVDVVGDALKLVIIAKLPFPVPSDPLLQARSEILQKEGKNPFMEDSVPSAVVKFKQGFGRLMRSSSDRGCVLCLDQRLFTKQYGKSFLKSLPECTTSFGRRGEIVQEMERFYRNGA